MLLVTKAWMKHPLKPVFLQILHYTTFENLVKAKDFAPIKFIYLKTYSLGGRVSQLWRY